MTVLNAKEPKILIARGAKNAIMTKTSKKKGVNQTLLRGSWNVGKTLRKMISDIIFLFLYYVTCGLVEAISSRLQSRSHDSREKENGLRLDAIADPEEVQSCNARNRRSRKSNRSTVYDVSNQDNARPLRWSRLLRTNKIAQLHLPANPRICYGDHGDAIVQNNRERSKSRTQDGNEGASSTNEKIALDFLREKDSFSERKNSALALQSFAMCARLNANFMSEVRVCSVPKSATKEGDSQGECSQGECSSNSKDKPPAKQFVASRFEMLRKRFLVRETKIDPTKEKDSTEAREKLQAQVQGPSSSSKKSKQKMKGIRNVFKLNRSKKQTCASDELGAIQRQVESDSNTFDRDLYMRINKLTVCDDTGQSLALDPFLVQEKEPKLSEVPITYLTFNMGDEGNESSNKKKSRVKGLLARFKLTKIN